MRVKIIFLISTVISIFVSTSQAQSDPCTFLAVADSFRAAALSGDIQSWLTRYQESDCSSTVKQGVRLMERSYNVITSNENATATGIAPFWRGMGVHVEGQGYPEVTIEFTSIQSGRMRGVMYFNTRDGNGTRFSIYGNVYNEFPATRETLVWSQLMDGEDANDVVTWLLFGRDRIFSGDATPHLRNIAIVKSNGEMRVIVYDPEDNNRLISESILVAQEE